ncbi:hypothetical protein F9288_06195 [Sphingomonas sp. CL5.1]|nr:hypothetical protein [Sphingomonas sp. CL5.1]QKR98206.1 hypothetical protein F9288_06195 [Sphingomonas sp. CL5.1]
MERHTILEMMGTLKLAGMRHDTPIPASSEHVRRCAERCFEHFSGWSWHK